MFIHFDTIHKRDGQTQRHCMTANATLDTSIVQQKLSICDS